MRFNSVFKGLKQLSSWGWAQICSKHVEDSNKHTIEVIVRKVGYLPELNEDARSEKCDISDKFVKEPQNTHFMFVKVFPQLRS
jgi:hypothetical protein